MVLPLAIKYAAISLRALPITPKFHLLRSVVKFAARQVHDKSKRVVLGFVRAMPIKKPLR